MNQKKRIGLTLAELVVVLTILSIMALSASVMTTGVVEQARYDSTIKTLDAIRQSILGQPSTGAASGFVSEFGELPVSAVQLVATRHLQAGILPLPITGWGRDGWGNDLVCETALTDTLNLRPYMYTWSLSSLGADGFIGGDNRFDIVEPVTIQPVDYLAKRISFYVHTQNSSSDSTLIGASAGDKVVWKYVGLDPSATNPKSGKEAAINLSKGGEIIVPSTTNLVELFCLDEPTTTGSLVASDFTYLPIGSMQVYAVSQNGFRKSAVIHIAVTPGARIARNLVLPPP